MLQLGLGLGLGTGDGYFFFFFDIDDIIMKKCMLVCSAGVGVQALVMLSD